MRNRALLVLAVAVIALVIFSLISRRSRPAMGLEGEKRQSSGIADVPPMKVSSPQEADHKKDLAQERAPRLEVRVVTKQGVPIPEATVLCGLGRGKLTEEEEGQPRGSSGSLFGFRPSPFLGDPTTDFEGFAHFRLALPAGHPEWHITVQAEAKGFVTGPDYMLNVPEEGETKKVTLTLEPGRPIRGRIALQDDVDTREILVHIYEPDKTKDCWLAAPEIGTDGSFESEEAPRVPLRIDVKVFGGKFLEYSSVIDPSFDGSIDIVLQRNPEYVEKPRVVVSISNPPADGKLDWWLTFYSYKDNRLHDKVSNMLDTKPVEESLEEGAYEVLLIGLDNSNVWAREAFHLPAAGKHNVSLTLVPAARIRLKMTDSSTGKPPSTDNIDVEIRYAIGAGFHRIAWRPQERFLGDGIMDIPGVPPGNVKLVLDRRGLDRSKPGYKKVELDVTTVSGEQRELAVLLEPDEAKPPEEEK